MAKQKNGTGTVSMQLPTSGDAPDPAALADIQKRIAEAEARALGDVLIEFSHNGFVYVYDFDTLCIEAMHLAKSVFEFANNQLRNPARSLHEYEMTGQMDFTLKGMAYLVRKKTEDGKLEVFDRKETVGPARKFLASLTSRHWDELERAKANFFARLNIVDYGSVLQSMPLIGELSGSIQQSQPTKDGNCSAKN
jgi:hypothetical protein